jgi:hypothetical protein
VAACATESDWFALQPNAKQMAANANSGRLSFAVLIPKILEFSGGYRNPGCRLQSSSSGEFTGLKCYTE